MIKGLIVAGSATLAIAFGANFSHTSDMTGERGFATTRAALPLFDDVLVYCTADDTLCPDTMYVGREPGSAGP